jgi:hypothetical protein
VLSPFSRAPVASDIADAAGCVRFELDVRMSQSLLIVED